jgi:hypothetical protein
VTRQTFAPVRNIVSSPFLGGRERERRRKGEKTKKSIFFFSLFQKIHHGGSF